MRLISYDYLLMNAVTFNDYVHYRVLQMPEDGNITIKQICMLQIYSQSSK